MAAPTRWPGPEEERTVEVEEVRLRDLEAAPTRREPGAQPEAEGRTRRVPSPPEVPRFRVWRRASRGATRAGAAAACVTGPEWTSARLPRQAARVAKREAEVAASQRLGRCPSSHGSDRSSRRGPTGRQRRAGSWVRSSRRCRGPSCSPWPVLLLRAGAMHARVNSRRRYAASGRDIEERCVLLAAFWGWIGGHGQHETGRVPRACPPCGRRRNVHGERSRDLHLQVTPPVGDAAGW